MHLIIVNKRKSIVLFIKQTSHTSRHIRCFAIVIRLYTISRFAVSIRQKPSFKRIQISNSSIQHPRTYNTFFFYIRSTIAGITRPMYITFHAIHPIRGSIGFFSRLFIIFDCTVDSRTIQNIY